MTLRWAKSASKHGISPARTRYVIETYLPALKLPPELPDRPDEQIVYLGDDLNGTPLEVMTVDIGNGDELVIPSMGCGPSTSTTIAG